MRYTLALICALLWVTKAAGQSPTPAVAEPIGPERWRIEGRVEGESTVQLAKGADHFRTFGLQCTCLKDGDRLSASVSRFHGSTPVRAWQSIVDGWYLSYQAPPRGKAAVSGFYAAEGRRFVGEALPSGLAPFQDYFAGDAVPLAQVKQRATHIALSETAVDGARCQSVGLDSDDFGHYEVDYDPAAGYLPRAARVDKSGHHYAGRERLDEEPPRTPLGSAAPTPVVELHFTLDQVRLGRVEGRWFPLSCRITRVLRYADGNSDSTVMRWHTDSVKVNPVLPADAFKPRLQPGARLANLSEAHLPLQWKDGAAVPQVDPALVGQMDQTARALRDKREPSHAGAK